MTQPTAKTKPYVLLHGTHNGFEVNAKTGERVLANGKPVRKLFKEGETVHLTEAQYTAFKDKFKTKAEYDAAKSGKADESAAADIAAEKAELAKKAAALEAKEKELAEREAALDESEDDDDDANKKDPKAGGAAAGTKKAS